MQTEIGSDGVPDLIKINHAFRCPKIQHCENGEAPYRVPERCCPGCCEYNDHVIMTPCSHTRVHIKHFLLYEMLIMYNAVTTVDVYFGGDGGGGNAGNSEPIPNTWSAWSDWTGCSRSCGAGRQSRSRRCMSDNQLVLDCTGPTREVRTCNNFSCPSNNDQAVIKQL